MFKFQAFLLFNMKDPCCCSCSVDVVHTFIVEFAGKCEPASQEKWAVVESLPRAERAKRKFAVFSARRPLFQQFRRNSACRAAPLLFSRGAYCSCSVHRPYCCSVVLLFNEQHELELTFTSSKKYRSFQKTRGELFAAYFRPLS